MKIGVARVNRVDQNLSLQIDALLKAGVNEKYIFKDTQKRSVSSKKVVEKAFEKLREGDTLIVWKLDRVVGSLIQLVTLMRRLKEVGANFESIQEPFLNTTNANPYSEFLRGLFALLSQLELQIKGERSKAGQDAARSRNKQIGRKKGLNEKGKQDLILVKSYFLEKNNMTVDNICKKVKISRNTYYKYLEINGLKGKVRKYKSKE
jgi:DNA invertase Pin-like site-specific DNA recombinase